MTKLKQSERDASIASLRETLKPGDTVYTILRHVSRSGMQRVIDLIVMTPEGPRSITFDAARAMDDKIDRDRWGIKASGCGMDMGFNLVYNLSRTLFDANHPFVCIGDKCPSNDRANGERNYKPHPHSDGGYALKHRWL